MKRSGIKLLMNFGATAFRCIFRSPLRESVTRTDKGAHSCGRNVDLNGISDVWHIDVS
jgi:hypothetical protein